VPAETLDLYIEQGATFAYTITWRDSDDELVDLDGYTARMQLRSTEEAADPAALSLTTENSRIALGGAAGTIVLTVDADDTAAVTAGSYSQNGTTTFTAGTDWTEAGDQASQGTTFARTSGAQYRFVTSSSAYTGSGTTSATGNWAALMAAFRLEAA
jgi:hypothetical protein